MTQSSRVALAECRRFPILPQALVARSALEAAGLHPLVFDEFRAGIYWTEQFSLGGIRVMVPVEELPAARELIAELEGEPSPPGEAHAPLFLFLLLSCVIVGWPIAGFRLRDPFHRWTALVLSVAPFLLYLMGWLARGSPG